jgi:hypothetical protein
MKCKKRTESAAIRKDHKGDSATRVTRSFLRVGLCCARITISVSSIEEISRSGWRNRDVHCRRLTGITPPSAN